MNDRWCCASVLWMGFYWIKLLQSWQKLTKIPCGQCLVHFFFFLFSDLDLITDMEFPKHSQRFYEHLNSPLVKVLPCLTKLMAWDLSSHSGAQNVLCVPRVLTRFRQTYLQHLNVLKEEDVSIALPFCFTVCTFLLGPWPFQCLCAAKCSRPAGTRLPSRDQQSSHFQNKNLV